MPLRPARACSYPRCPNLVRGKSRYCEEHDGLTRREYDRTRGSSRERGYTGTWEKVRKSFLASCPLCERCEESGQVKVASIVHHRDRNPRNNIESNLEALCNDCHEREHRAERFRG